MLSISMPVYSTTKNGRTLPILLSVYWPSTSAFHCTKLGAFFTSSGVTSLPLLIMRFCPLEELVRYSTCRGKNEITRIKFHNIACVQHGTNTISCNSCSSEKMYSNLVKYHKNFGRGLFDQVGNDAVLLEDTGSLAVCAFGSNGQSSKQFSFCGDQQHACKAVCARYSHLDH